jgi:hypothetical protein
MRADIAHGSLERDLDSLASTAISKRSETIFHKTSRGDEFWGIAVQAARRNNEIAAATYTTRFSEHLRGIVGGLPLEVQRRWISAWKCNEDGCRLDVPKYFTQVGKYIHTRSEPPVRRSVSAI